MTIDDEIKAERQRQRDLKAAGKFKYTCADPELTNFERLSILLEEVGEAAHELGDHSASTRLLDRASRIARQCNDRRQMGADVNALLHQVRSLHAEWSQPICFTLKFSADDMERFSAQRAKARTELIQVAAVCDAWLEALAKEQGQ